MVRQIVVVIGGMGLRELEMPLGIAKNWQLCEARPHIELMKSQLKAIV